MTDAEVGAEADEALPAGLRARLDQLFRTDALASGLGVDLVDWAPGRAEVRWTPSDEHANFLGSVHGGAIFSCADVAFAVANNSRGQISVALSVDVQFLAAAQPGLPLRATAVEQSRSRRIASYQLRVEEAGGGALVASFAALGYRTDRWHFGAEAWPTSWRDQP